MNKIPPCEKCSGEKFCAIPDSLALFCEGCGFVWVMKGNGAYEKGASIQEWLEDLYGSKQEKKDM